MKSLGKGKIKPALVAHQGVKGEVLHPVCPFALRHFVCSFIWFSPITDSHIIIILQY